MQSRRDYIDYMRSEEEGVSREELDQQSTDESQLLYDIITSHSTSTATSTTPNMLQSSISGWLKKPDAANQNEQPQKAPPIAPPTAKRPPPPPKSTSAPPRTLSATTPVPKAMDNWTTYLTTSYKPLQGRGRRRAHDHQTQSRL
jgi:hypothetical protein